MLGALIMAILMTPFGEKVTAENAWREYPRPQMVRSNWKCLNGEWDYSIVTNTVACSNSVPWRFYGEDIEVAKGKILVPFAFESALSGVGRIIEPHETMIYTRKFEWRPKVTKATAKFRTLLHFECVDLRTQVYVNGVEVTDKPHLGGQVPFEYDITDFLKSGENELQVVVHDPTLANKGLFGIGKQTFNPQSCFYTRVSGICGTVWFEQVPATYIDSYRVIPDIDKNLVNFQVKVKGEGEERIVKFSLPAGTPTLKIPLSHSHFPLELSSSLPSAYELWSPENPKLYDFTLRYGADEVKGYFAMRKFAKGKDAKGVWRFFLNNKAYYPVGTLDQGWWPDGLLTPPSVEACAFDIKTLKDCGFNMMRKHIKVEPRIYYHLCDTLGILIFQDMPCGTSLQGGHNTQDSVTLENNYGTYRDEWKQVVDHLYSVPSIVMWIPYNEAWGQHNRRLTLDTLRWTKRYDPSRLVDGPSGWNDYEGGDMIQVDKCWKISREPFAECLEPVADCNDRHDYEPDAPKPLTNITARVALLGEFGGLGLRVPGHLWNPDKYWGYNGSGKDTDPKAVEAKYVALMEKLAKASEKCYSGSVYTQTTDVEGEINGLMTYDRKVLKFDPAVLKAAHDKIRATVEK